MRKVSLWGCMTLILTLWFQEMTLFGILNKYPSLACLSVSFLAVRRCSSLSGYTNTLNSNLRLWIVHFENLRLVKGFWVNLRRLLIQENYHYSVGCSQGLVRRELPADYIYDFPICRVKVMPRIQNWPLLLTCRLMWINLCFLNGVMKLNVRRISNYSLCFGFCERACSTKSKSVTTCSIFRWLKMKLHKQPMSELMSSFYMFQLSGDDIEKNCIHKIYIVIWWLGLTSWQISTLFDLVQQSSIHRIYLVGAGFHIHLSITSPASKASPAVWPAIFQWKTSTS